MNNKTLLSRALAVAGAFALAGAAHADAVFFPDGTMVDLGENGAERIVWNADGTIHALGPVDTTVLGGPAAVTTTTTVTTLPAAQSVYVQPNIDFDPHAVRAQIERGHVALHGGTHVMGAAPQGYGTVIVGQPHYVLSY